MFIPITADHTQERPQKRRREAPVCSEDAEKEQPKKPRLETPEPPTECSSSEYWSRGTENSPRETPQPPTDCSISNMAKERLKKRRWETQRSKELCTSLRRVEELLGTFVSFMNSPFMSSAAPAMSAAPSMPSRLSSVPVQFTPATSAAPSTPPNGASIPAQPPKRPKRSGRYSPPNEVSIPAQPPKRPKRSGRSSSKTVELLSALVVDARLHQVSERIDRVSSRINKMKKTVRRFQAALVEVAGDKVKVQQIGRGDESIPLGSGEDVSTPLGSEMELCPHSPPLNEGD